MTYFGMPFGSALGDPDKHLAVFVPEVVRSGTAISIRLKPSTGFGNAWFCVYVNANIAGYTFLTEGLESTIEVPAPAGVDELSVRVLHQGQNYSFNADTVTRVLEEDTAQKVTVSWTWAYDEIGIFDDAGAQITTLTNLDLSGVTYESADRLESVTRGAFDVEVAVSGGNATVSVSRQSTILCSGTGALGGTVTLTEQNSSGISGTVDVAGGAVAFIGSLYIRWPASMRVKRDTVVIETVTFNGENTATWTESADLAAGSYDYSLQAISDTGDAGDESTPDTVVIPGTPDAPEDLSYASGNAAATVLSFTASETVGATYRAYIQQIGAEFLDLENIAATAAAGATTITLPAITGAPGVARAIVRAVNAGVEEDNADVLEIEYDAAGAYVPPRPNTAAVGAVAVSDGDTITVEGNYDDSNEATTATQVQLFVRTPSGTFDFGTPDDTASLSSVNQVKSAELTKTGLADGWYYVTVKAADAIGTQSAVEADEVAVYVSSANVAAPVGDFVVSRG